MAALSRTTLQTALSTYGLRLRGGWIPGEGDALPAMPGGHSAAVVWMVGVVGSEFWPFFKASAQYQEYGRDGLPDPLDRWSRAIGSELASQWGGVALYPFDGPPLYPKFHPFQQWATRAEPLQTSPLMLRIHPDHGLWHAYRFALALPELTPGDLAWVTPPASVPNLPSQDLCLTCTGQPCLSACPVKAFTGTAYTLEACAGHLHTPDGADCMTTGCLARRACPVGQGSRYLPEHAAFHMQAFAGHHGGSY
jgi:hypothetical protein